MKIHYVIILAAILLVSGCAHQSPMGAAADTDRNVLTGGPMRGTQVDDLPLPVMGALRKQAPQAEIADIDLTLRGKTQVYEISFREPGKKSKMFITPKGEVLATLKMNP
jgi:hypothetical protein